MSNVDELEIKKFEALAARWWDPTSEFKPLHEINPLRMGFLTSKTTLAGKRVLDIGCGGAYSPRRWRDRAPMWSR